MSFPQALGYFVFSPVEISETDFECRLDFVARAPFAPSPAGTLSIFF